MKKAIKLFYVLSAAIFVFSNFLSAAEKNGPTIKERPVIKIAVADKKTQNDSNSGNSPVNPVKKALSAEDRSFLKKTIGLCSVLKKDCSEPDQKKQIQRFDILKKTIAELKENIAKSSDEDNTQSWINFLELNELEKELSSDKLDLKACQNTLKALNSQESGLEFDIFLPLREKLTDLLKQKKTSWTQQEKDDFKYVCDQLPKDLENLLRGYDNNKAELATISLAYLRDYSVNQTTYEELKNLVLDYFSKPNCRLVISDKLMRKDKKQSINENIEVSEYIRGSQVIGNGTVSGTVDAQYVPNEEKAEIKIVIHATVNTQTSAYQNSVQVKSDNTGTMYAQKSIFFSDYITSMPAIVKGSMNSNITGIFSDRTMGWNIIQQRVAEEQPYSKAESQRRMEERFSERLDREVDSRIAPTKEYLDLKFYKFLHEIDFVPRFIKSSTTEKNLFWSALLASKTQLGLPKNDLLPPKDKNSSSDVDLSLHVSAINNAFFNSFSGKRVSDQDIAKRLSAVFTSEKNNDKKTTDTPLWLIFSSDLPIDVSFANNEIKTVMHLDGFEKDDKSYPELTIEFVYKIEKTKEGFVIRRTVLDARPGDLAPGQIIPARYQAIRTLILDKLGPSLKDKIEVNPIDTVKIAKDRQKKESADKPSKEKVGLRPGFFLPVACSASNGWLSLQYIFVPDKNSK